MGISNDTGVSSQQAGGQSPSAEGRASVMHPARQPLVDADGLLHGFELIAREPNGSGDHPDEGGERKPHAEADAAAARTLAMLGASGLHAALGGHRGYLNASRALLLSDAFARISPDRFFLELPPDIEADAELVSRLVTLHAKRHRFVLDHVTQPNAAFAKLLPYAYAIKVEVDLMEPELLVKLSGALKSAGKILIALGVESQETFERAKAAQFDLFQGYFFARGHKQAARRASAPRQALLNLLRLLTADPTVAQLEAELKLNPVLVMHLMRLANSGESSIGRKVETLRDAITATGTNRIARWTQLLLYADGRKVRLEDDPLLQMAATRARFMEMAVARLATAERKVVDGAFLTGVFSLVDAVFGGSLEETLDALTLGSHIRAAILHRAGTLGTLLDAIEALERADWAALDRTSAALAPLTAVELAELGTAAAAWASSADQSEEHAGLDHFDD